MTVLVVTRSDDNNSVTRVMAALARRGVRAIRLDTDRFPDLVTVSSTIVPGGVRRALTTTEGRLDLEEVSAVWYRRFHAGAALPDSLDTLRAPAVDESRRALAGTIAALGCRHVDRLEDIRRCDHKELQLLRARTFGLSVPRTLFTNDPAEARAFFEACAGRVVTKMQSSFAVMDGGEETVVFTSAVDRDHLDELVGLRFAPMIFQERLRKRLDVRATVVGDRVLTAAVEPGALLDWRTDGVGLMGAWRKHTLPRDVERGLLELVRSIGLSYAAADFVVDDDGRHMFLELNAGGEWFWLDDLLGVAAALADVLAPAVSPRRAPRGAAPTKRPRRGAPAGRR